MPWATASSSLQDFNLARSARIGGEQYVWAEQREERLNHVVRAQGSWVASDAESFSWQKVSGALSAPVPRQGLRLNPANASSPLQPCPMKSARGVARLVPSAVNPPKWSFAWLHVIASADRHPRHTRSLQPLWQHEPRVPTKICITRAHLLYSAPAGGSSVSETTPPTQADRTGHPPRKLLANSRTSANPPWEDATRPQSPLARTQSLNTSAIRTLVPDLIPGLFNNGCICWLRCAPQQYSLQGSTILVSISFLILKIGGGNGAGDCT